MANETEKPALFLPIPFMFIEFLQCHLAVCAQRDLPRMAKLDPDFWNVISIREPARPPIQRQGFQKVHTLICYDMIGKVGVEENSTLGTPRKEHMQLVFRFADSLAGEPILVHCWAGISRSTAIALCLIVRGMHFDGFGYDDIRKEAPEILIAMRPQAAPNPLILGLGLSEFLPSGDAERLLNELVNHPAFFANRFKGAEPK